MNSELNVIDAILHAKGYAVTFEPLAAGSVICRAVKGSNQFRVLAKSVSDGMAELARLLSVHNTGWRINP